MDVETVIRARRQHREFTDRPVTREQLDAILEAGRRAPSSRNSQPWQFLATTNPGILARLAETGPGTGFVAGAPALVALAIPATTDPYRASRYYYDIGQVSMSMQVTATSLGLAVGQASVRDQATARQALDLDESLDCPFLLAFGYPVRPIVPVAKPDRHPLARVVTWLP